MRAKFLGLFKRPAGSTRLGRVANQKPLRPFGEKCADATALLKAKGYSGGKLLAYYPRVKQNPFQQMLYASGFESGFACFDAQSVDDMLAGPKGQPLIAHYHWLYNAMKGAKNAQDAAAMASVFLDKVRAQKGAGHTVIWTVHNILSHNSAFPEEEATLRAEMAKLADHIHIMNPDTVALCAPYYEVPEHKVFHVPHPSYSGVYGDYLSKAEARHTLGLQAEDKVFLLFGSMMPQKGSLRFLAQLDALQKAFEGRARIVIAGKANDEAYMAKVMQLIAGRGDVQLHSGYVSDQQVQLYFKAADVAVCPYALTLNSGVVMTAASFGRSSVVPNVLAGVLADVARQTAAYDSEDMDACIAACVKAVAISEVADTEAVLRNWAKSLAPRYVSNRFFDVLRGYP
ncbi:MAG: glycosyltransferase [Kordiimonadaceae bacterium]|nr:glycosyltransferase [Kordiimonadaceae bacterium]